MSRVICPTCGEEFDIQSSKKYSTATESFNNPKDTNIIGTLVPANKNNNKGETKMNTKETFNIAELAKMVAEYQKNQESTVSSVSNEINPDFGKFGKTSKFYGKKLCGDFYNPFMVRRFLPKQFKQLMKNFDRNVDAGIKGTVTYMNSIFYTIKEIAKLSLMENKDPIAFRERSLFFTLSSCKGILLDYYGKCLEQIDMIKEKAIKDYENGKNVTSIVYDNTKYNVKFDLSIDNSNKRPIAKTNITVDWKVEENIVLIMNKISNASTYTELWHIISSEKKFHKLETGYSINRGPGKYFVVKKQNNNQLSKDFIEAYKKSGAYYTIKSELITDELNNNSMGLTYLGLSGKEATTLLRKNLVNGHEGFNFYKELKDMLDKAAEQNV